MDVRFAISVTYVEVVVKREAIENMGAWTPAIRIARTIAML